MQFSRDSSKGAKPPVRGLAPFLFPQNEIFVSVPVTGHLILKFSDYMLVLCQNYIFVHMTKKNFLVTGLHLETTVPLTPKWKC